MSMSEIKKYVLRFGIILAIALPIMLIADGARAVKIIAYKVSLASIGIGLAELVWAVFFKPVYGKTEEMPINEQKSILVFRGMLYAAIILALTLGL